MENRGRQFILKPAAFRVLIPVTRFTLITLFIALVLRASQGPQPSVFLLEIPELQLVIEGSGNATVPHDLVESFDVRIRRTDLDFGAIHSKINTESADIIMTKLARRDEVICRFNLSLRGGFRLNPGRNSVEISFEDRRGRIHYASFLLDDERAGPYRAPSPTPSQQFAGQRYAVIIGISKYANSTPELYDLNYAARDAEAVSDFLLSPGGGGFKRENVLLLTDEMATLKAIRTALFTFLTRPRQEDLVLIYFAGHGFQDPNDPRQLYLMAHDSEYRNMGGTALLMSDLQDVFERILKPRQVITFADACHSGGIDGTLFGVESDRNNLINQYLARVSSRGKRAVITASDISENSYESDRLGHGIFTYYLLQGIRGAADLNDDKTVVAGELFEYVQREVRLETGQQQNPSIIGGLAESLAIATRQRSQGEY